MLNIVTTYAWTGSSYVVPSAAAKTGVLALIRSLAVEWGPYGIRQVAIAPGPFPNEGAWTRLMPRPDLQEQFLHTNPLRSVGQMAELIIKELMYKSLDMDLQASLHLEGQLQEAAYATADHREAVDAFLHKRVAKFTGK